MAVTFGVGGLILCPQHMQDVLKMCQKMLPGPDPEGRWGLGEDSDRCGFCGQCVGPT